ATKRTPQRNLEHSRVPYIFIYCYPTHQNLHSFPTRRSSDLDPAVTECRRFPPQNLARCCRTLEHSPSRTGRRTAARRSREAREGDRKSTRLNSSHVSISYAVFCLKKKKHIQTLSPYQPILHN